MADPILRVQLLTPVCLGPNIGDKETGTIIDLDYTTAMLLVAHHQARYADLEVPVITSIDPPSVAVGDPDFRIRVIGTGFTAGSQIIWNGYPERTDVLNEPVTELSTIVKMSMVQYPVTIQIQVRTPGDPPQLSAPMAFEITETAPLRSRES